MLITCYEQVSDHLEMDREDSDEAKVAALGQVLAVGETVYVKVGPFLPPFQFFSSLA